MTPRMRWERVRQIAERCYGGAIDMMACIVVLERGNEQRVIEAINDAGADETAEIIRNALFGRMHLASMHAYDPIRKGDKHLGVAFELLSDPTVMACAPEGHREALKAARVLFEAAKADPRLVTLRHYRNKFAAHISEPNPNIPLPLIRELIGFAKDTAMVAEKLAHGTGVITIKLELQLEGWRESADAFWSKWG